MTRRRHPKKEVEAALRYAEDRGWTVVPTAGGHRWGYMRCPQRTRQGHQESVWSTPRNSDLHAARLRRAVDRCQHVGDLP
ncbi:MAG: hypothetical protein KY462_16085 [Actinobacteria bacterium]|nr:hypothetical protein [Actinomycetota bacterium]